MALFGSPCWPEWVSDVREFSRRASSAARFAERSAAREGGSWSVSDALEAIRAGLGPAAAERWDRLRFVDHVCCWYLLERCRMEGETQDSADELALLEEVLGVRPRGREAHFS